MSDDGLPMNQGALYPVLRSLERNGLLTSEIEASSSGPPRRYYKPTSAGKAVFEEWIGIWMKTKNWLDGVLEQNHERTSSKGSKRSARGS
jgi:PadR family transcriptional regulator, regulatory protein PadR